MADPTPTAAPAAPPPGSVTLYDKATNAPIVVDAADAPKHILSGQLNYAPGTKIPVVFKGQASTVDADELGDAFKAGASPLSSKDFHASEVKAQYGSTGQAALAFGAGALDSATIGASNALIGGIGGADTREYMRGIAEANPAANTAGEVAGFIAPIAADVLSAGTLTPALAAAETARLAERGIVRAGAETAVSALRAPTRLVSGIGEVAEGVAKTVVGHNAESAAGRVAQNIIAGGARGAAEGGIYGVGAEVGHQYLQENPDLTGETLGTAWWHGALAGGVLGGALHGVGGMLKKAPALERAERAALDEGGGVAARENSVVADAVAKKIIGQVDDPHTAEVLTKAWKEGPKAFAKHDELLGDASRKIVTDLDGAIEAGRIVDRASFGESKSNHIRKLVPVENLKAAQAMAMNVWSETSKVIEGLEAQTMKGGAEGSVKRLRKWLDDFGDMSDKGQWKDPAELFDKIDDFKRRVGKEAGFGRGVHGREEATNAFNALYENTLRPALENEATWGPAAVAQREVNLATSNMIDTGQKFSQKFTTQYGSEAVTGAPLYIADSAKVNGFVHGLTSPANDTTAKMAADYVTNRGNFLEAVSKNYALDTVAKTAVKNELAALKSMSETIAKTGSDVSQINQLKQIMAEEKGHAIHGIIGMALDAVSRPGLTLARLAELEATKNRALAKIDSSLQSIKSAINGTGERRKPGLLPSTPDTYEKRRAAVLAAASKPDDLHAHISGAASPVGPSAPATAMAFQRAGLRTVQYLMSELPKPQPRAGSLTPKLDAEQWTASDQQKSQFDRKFDAATHPTDMLDRVANGTITAQHVEAMQATRPAMLAHQREKLQSVLDAQTKPVPTHMQGPIKTFLGIPQMDPGLQKFMQAPPQDKKSPGLKRPMKMADNTTLNATKE